MDPHIPTAGSEPAPAAAPEQPKGGLPHVPTSAQKKAADIQKKALEVASTAVVPVVKLPTIQDLVAASYAENADPTLILSQARHASVALPLITLKNRSEFFTHISILFERAAKLYEKRGDFTLSAAVRAELIKSMPIDASHPLYNLGEVLRKNRVKLAEGGEKQFKMGAFLDNMGTGIVKECQLHGVLNDDDSIRLDCRINHWARPQLQHTIDAIQKNLPEFEALMKSSNICKQVTMKKSPFQFTGKDAKGNPSFITLGEKVEIHFHGIGTISIGIDPKFSGVFHQLTIELEPNKTAADLRNILAHMGLSELICPSRTQDQEVMQLITLLHAFYPKTAFDIERDPVSFQLSAEQLKKKIVKAEPGIQDVIKKHSVIPSKQFYGRQRLAVTGLDEIAKQNGLQALGHGVSGWTKGFDFAKQKVVSMVKYGCFSSATRFKSGMITPGASSEADCRAGGFDKFFTRAIPKKLAGASIRDNFYFSGDILVVLNLKALNLGSYQYHEDSWGIRNTQYTDAQVDGKKYIKRQPIGEFAKQQERAFTADNEVMLPDLSGEYIQALIIAPPTVADWKKYAAQHTAGNDDLGLIHAILSDSDEATLENIQALLSPESFRDITKQITESKEAELIKALDEAGLIKEVDKRKYCGTIPIEKFVQTSDRFSKETLNITE